VIVYNLKNVGGRGKRVRKFTLFGRSVRRVNEGSGVGALAG